MTKVVLLFLFPAGEHGGTQREQLVKDKPHRFCVNIQKKYQFSLPLFFQSSLELACEERLTIAVDALLVYCQFIGIINGVHRGM